MKALAASRPPGHWGLAVLGLAVVYYAAARLGLLLAFEGSNASPVWPPSGIALAALLLYGWRMLPGVALGALVANLVVFSANDAAEPATRLLASLAIMGGNALEALVGALALRRWVGARHPFDDLAGVAKFIVVVLGAAAISAAVGSATLLAAGIVPTAALAAVALTWWTGDVTGMLVLAPLLITLGAAGLRPAQRREGLEALGLLALVALLGALVLLAPQASLGADRRFVWLFVPCIAWAAFRHGSPGVGATSLLIAGLAVWGTTRGLGPFARGNLNDALIGLQTFVALCTVTGLLLAADRHERLRLGRAAALRRDLVTPWLVLIGCLGIAVVGWHVVASDSERRAQERFEFVASGIEARVTDRMHDYEQVLRGGAGLFAASQSVERDEWKRYVERLQLAQSYPGIQALAFAVRVAAGGRDAHVAAVHAEGLAQYGIRPPGERDEYGVVLYIEPFEERNRRALGYDMLTEPVRRAAMLAARDSGNATLSGKLVLQQETGRDVQAGLVLYAPVYRNGAAVATVDERRAALVGYVSSVFRMNDLMAGILGRDLLEARLRVYDGDAASESALLYDSHREPGAARQAAVPALWAVERTLALPNQRWHVRVEALPAFEAALDRQKAQLVLIAGVGISLLLFALVRSQTLTRERAELLAEDMTVALRDSERLARHAEQQLRAVMDATPLGVFFTDPRGARLYTNHAWQRMTGLSGEQALGFGWLAAVHPDDRERVAVAWQAAWSTRASYRNEYRVRSVGGALMWVHVVAVPLDDADGALGHVGLMEDITQRRAMDAELAAKNDALLRSNTELAQFAYVASHDLQEPLRTVASYSQLLLRRHRAQLPGEAQEFVDFIGDGAKRAQALVADLLSLARLDSQAEALRPVALGELLDDIRRQLGMTLREAGAQLSHDALPTVHGDRGQLGQLLQNLISNAVKFRGSAPPRVHVSAQREADGPWRVSVADNGIGIDARFHERIFTLFQRLHRGDYPGTGIGLAICKKVVERHGGRIGVSSEPGRGSTFFFTIADQGTTRTGTTPAAQDKA